MTDVTLRKGPLTVVLRPEAGGRIALMRHDALGDLIVPMTDAPYEPEFWPKAGAYPLIPFQNRVRGGRFIWDGTEHRLPLHPSEPNALHGFASRRHWKSDGAGTMTLDHQADEAWPWNMRAAQRISLTPSTLTVALSVTNCSATTMPAGLGWHPFFPPCTVQEDAARSWPLGNDLMPSGASVAKVSDGPTRYLSDWRVATIALEDGAKLRMTASTEMTHLIVHHAPSYSCIEPASHLANALASPPVAATDGMQPLAPGITFGAWVTLTIL